MIGQAFLGASLILLLGVLLALAAAWLPRLASLWETPAAREGGLPAEEAPVRAMPTREAPLGAGTPLEVAPSPPPTAEGEETLLAAAVALALSFYEGEAGTAWREPSPAPGGATPWSLSGRLSAMQARQRLQKR
jgi:hypothetical protein